MNPIGQRTLEEKIALYGFDPTINAIDSLTREYVCAKCGKTFALMIYNVGSYTYTIRKNDGKRYYCSHRCWWADAKNKRQSFC